MKRYLLVGLFVFCVGVVFGELFKQDFSTSEDVSAYVNSKEPESGQFNSISNYLYNQASIVDGVLRFTKTGKSTAYLLRNTDLGAPNSLLIIKFKIRIRENLSGGTNQIRFFVGSDFEDNVADPTDGNIFSKLGINFGSVEGVFSIRNLVSGTNSQQFSGQQQVTIAINNSGTVKYYLSPEGSLEIVESDKIDVWVGESKVFDEIIATSRHVKPDNFKFTYPSNNINAIVEFDDFFIYKERIYSPVFHQSFETSEQLSEYYNLDNPLITQFNSISNLSGNVCEIENGKLKFTKNNNTPAYLARTNGFGVPNALMNISFDFELQNNAEFGSNQIGFYLGANFNNDKYNPALSNIHTQFSINFDSIGVFSIKAQNSFSGSFRGKQKITLIVNNTGENQAYKTPSGEDKIITNDLFDIWIGNALVLRDVPAVTATANLNNIKLIYYENSKNAVIKLDNFIITKSELFSSVEPVEKDKWIGMGLGAGGYLNGIQAGPTGIMMCNSDLSGTYISKDRGVSWTNIGSVQGLVETHACGMGFDPINEKVFFIGTEKGIYRTENEGGTFTKVFDGIFCTDIVLSKSNNNIGYAAGNSGVFKNDGAVFKTFDNGRTWEKVSVDLPVSNIMIQEIIIHPTNPDILYAHSYEGRFVSAAKALYKSVNGGINWIEVAPEILRNEIYDITIDPTNFERMYASGTNIGVAKSVDGGNTWTIQKTAGLGAIHVKNDSPNVVRVFQDWRYKESQDYGETWSAKPYWPTSYFLPGTKWAVKPRKGFDMSDSDTYFWWNSCWAWATFDGGKTIHNIWTKELSPGSGWWTTRGLENAIAWDIVISEANPDVVYAGFWDMGMWRSLDHGQTWQSSNNLDYAGGWKWSVDGNSKQGVGGNTKTICADPERAQVVWATLQGNQNEPIYLCKSENYGKFDSWIPSSGIPSSTEVFGLSVDYNSPLDNRILYVTVDGNVYKSINDGMLWTKISEGINCQYTLVDRFNSDVVFAGGLSGLYKSTNAGSTWTKINEPDLNAGIHDIKIDPSNPGWIYVVCFGTAKGLYLSKDFGMTWQKLLEDNYMRGVAVDPVNPNNLYVACSSAKAAGGYKVNSKGMLWSRDGGKTWFSANEGLSWPFAWSIKVDPHDPSCIFASLNGQSIKKRRISDLEPLAHRNVKLSGFYANVKDNNCVEIIWKTASEKSNDRFVLYKSINGVDYTELSIKEGIGSSIEKAKYEVIDNHPVFGQNYYKLVQYNDDDIAVEMGVRQIYWGIDTGLSTIEGEVKKKVKIIALEKDGNLFLNIKNLPNGTYNVHVYNAIGSNRLDKEIVNTSEESLFNIGVMEEGAYLVKIYGEDTISTPKIIFFKHN